jgi:hypothetical protein
MQQLIAAASGPSGPIFLKPRCCAVQLWASDTLALRSLWRFLL